MSATTSIEWADATWPIANGCRRKSPGCQFCYAERLVATRLKHQPKYAGLATMTAGGPRWTGKSRLWRPDLLLPLRWRKPKKVFVANMGDLFWEEVPDESIDRVFAVMGLAPKHTFQVLTKRPERMLAYMTTPGRGDRLILAAGSEAGRATPAGWKRLVRLWNERDVDAWARAPVFPNVWLGVSVEDQQRADERIPLLLQTPAAVRFLSVEPLLGPVNLCAVPDAATRPEEFSAKYSPLGDLDWVIVGGESGPGARPCDVAWIRSIVEQCRAAEVACFVKQLGQQSLQRRGTLDLVTTYASRKGGDPSEWPEDLRVREFPEVARA